MLCIACGESTPSAPCTHCGGEPRLAGRWALGEVLGQGANGTTYRATDAQGRVVAAKESTLRATDSAKLRELVEREARVLRQLDLEGVPSYVDEVWHQQGRARSLFLLQEFVEGVDLATRLEAHRYDEAEVVALLDELAGVLDHLHRRSPPILHRDIKPSNVMRRPDGRHVLIDFGSVRDVMKDAQLGGSTVAGTFGYMAPEQFAGDASPRSDLYGLGALAVALLTRQDPAQLLGHDRRMAWHAHTVVSPELAALLDRMLSPDAAARPAGAAEVQAALRGLTAEALEREEAVQPEPLPRPAVEERAPEVAFADRPEPVAPEPFHQPPARHEGRATLPEGGAMPHESGHGLGILAWLAGVAVAGAVALALFGQPAPEEVVAPVRAPVAEPAIARVELAPAPWPTLTPEAFRSVPDAPVCEITYLPGHEAHVGACPEALRDHVEGWVDLHAVDTRGAEVTTELAFVARPDAAWVLPETRRHVLTATDASYAVGEAPVAERVFPTLPEALEGQSVARTVCFAEVDVGGQGQADAVTLSGCPAPFHPEAVKALERWRWTTDAPVRTTVEVVFRPRDVGTTRSSFERG